MTRATLIAGALLVSVIALAAFTPRFLMLQSQDSNVGYVSKLNCVGGDTACTVSGRTGTVSRPTSGAPNPITDQVLGMVFMNREDLLTWSLYGIGGGTVATVGGTVGCNTATNANNVTGATRSYIRMQTVCNTGPPTVATFNFTNAPVLRPRTRPIAGFPVMTDATTVTLTRYFVGITIDATTYLAAPPNLSAASSNDYAAFRYDSAVQSGKWLCCSGDGTTESCLVMDTTVTAATEYRLKLDFSTAGTLICSIEGTDDTITKTTNLTTANGGMNFNAAVVSTQANNQDRSLYLNRFVIYGN